jgi:hypothetical protein
MILLKRAKRLQKKHSILPFCPGAKLGQDFGIVPTKTLPYTSCNGQIGWPAFGPTLRKIEGDQP